RARLNCISHLLEQIPYGDLTPEPIKHPPRRADLRYLRPPITDQHPRPPLNCTTPLLEQIPYGDLPPEPIKLPPRRDDLGYVRPPMTDQTFVPDRYRGGGAEGWARGGWRT